MRKPYRLYKMVSIGINISARSVLHFRLGQDPFINSISKIQINIVWEKQTKLVERVSAVTLFLF